MTNSFYVKDRGMILRVVPESSKSCNTVLKCCVMPEIIKLADSFCCVRLHKLAALDSRKNLKLRRLRC